MDKASPPGQRLLGDRLEHWAETTPDAEALAFGELAHYKCPRAVTVVDELPRTPTGKILKRELRKPYWADRDRQI